MEDDEHDVPTRTAAKPPLPETRGGAEQNVLIVDDDEDFAASLCGLLRLDGYNPCVARDRASALAELATRRVAVALIDVRLGTGSGVDLLREVRLQDPDLVCVMVTAYASIDTAIEALQAGAYDYLSKPFHSEDLLAMLARCFERIRLVEERRIAAERLGQKQRLEAMGQLTSGIAHDFNNVLTVLLSNLRWLEERLAGQPELVELVADALDAVRSGSDLTERLLHFARQHREEATAVDLSVDLPPLMRVLRRTLGEGIEIAVTLAEDLKPVFIPPGQLGPSLLNLALNARDAMSGGGNLRLDARNLIVGHDDRRAVPGLRPGHYVLLSVTDTGHGMPLAIRRQALRPMFSTKPPGAGSGLGLSMVDEFVRHAGGGLAIDSAPGKGTCVNLYLPCQPSPVGAKT